MRLEPPDVSCGCAATCPLQEMLLCTFDSFQFSVASHMLPLRFSLASNSACATGLFCCNVSFPILFDIVVPYGYIHLDPESEKNVVFNPFLVNIASGSFFSTQRSTTANVEEERTILVLSCDS